MLGHEALELRHEIVVAAEVEIGLDARLGRREAKLLEPRGVVLCESLMGELAERGPAPQRQGGSQQLGGARRVAVGERGATLAREPLEAQRVDLPGLDRQRVSASGADDHVVGEGSAQVGDVNLHCLDRGGGRSLAPHQVDDAIHRHGLSAVEQEDREHGAPTRSSQFDRPTLGEDLQRAEDQELEHCATSRRARLAAALPTYNHRLPLCSRTAGASRRIPVASGGRLQERTERNPRCECFPGCPSSSPLR